MAAAEAELDVFPVDTGIGQRELDGFGTQIPYQVSTTADGGVEVDAVGDELT